jgi:hypothetical protein
MNTKTKATYAVLLLIFVITLSAITWSQAAPQAANTTWYFAVSGDSRDCGDLIMPKIAQAIADNRQSAPVEFYWHLGDLRAIYRIDCDIAKDGTKEIGKDFVNSGVFFQCSSGRPSDNETKPSAEQTKALKDKYLSQAWPDFIKSQITPFEKLGLPFYLGIGNHELIKPKTRDQFRDQFKKWLTNPAIQDQRASDRTHGIDSKDGDTYFHFIWKGVDIIYLDNAGIYDDQGSNQDPGFSEVQLKWLDLVLKRDEADPQVKAIIVGMHAALPESVAKDHAMDRNCASFCSGKRAYNRLGVTQSRGKKIYILASHSHYFEEYVYDTPEHNYHGLRGWIIGTAGAEQYRPEIRYGYLLVGVSSDGTVRASFERVYRDSLPNEGAQALVNYCFDQNKRLPSTQTEEYKTASDCHCPVP